MHVHVTLYFLASVGTSVFFANGLLTTVLLLLLLLIQQYFYFMLFAEPDTTEPTCYCAECEKMTPESYVHCKTCARCVPVTHHHWKFVDRCVSRAHSNRYAGVCKLVLSTNVLCTAIESVAYPPFLVVLVGHLFAYKSISKRVNMHI
jgi:hypothetical protein